MLSVKPVPSNSPNEIKAFLFDYGGVLTNAGKPGSLRQEIAEHFGISPAEVKVDDIEKLLQAGLITSEVFFQELNKRHPSDNAFSEAAFLNTKDELGCRSSRVLELADKIRSNKITTGILSNVFEISSRQLRELGCYDGFSPVILSHEVKIVKPEGAIYELALERLKVEAEEVVFIDDNLENLIPARKLGMFTVHAKSEKQLTKGLPALLEARNGINFQID
jgi:epoxide hydrolase-like predicted phosphatase